jgi:hypothetical protein
MVAPAIELIARATLMEEVTVRFLPVLVGKSDAHVQLQREGGGYSKKRMTLHWGGSPLEEQISRALFSAARKEREFGAFVRETNNAKGKLVRLEWVGNVPRR